MMRFFTFLIVTSLHATSFAQIKYAPVFTSQCGETIIEDYFQVLDSNGHYFFSEDIFSNEVTLPKLGYYLIQDPMGEFEAWINITTDNQKDTFFIPALYIPLCVCSPPNRHYDFCDQQADGYHVDYYQKGKLRREGTFKDGLPIDTVKTYYYSGEIKEYHIPQNGGDKYVDFYKNGNLKREIDRKSQKYIDYYESGEILSYSQYFGNKRIEEDYYENGRLKRKQNARREIRYASSGLTTDVLKRTISYGHFSRRYRGYEVCWKRFNANDELVLELTVSMPGEYARFPEEIAKIDFEDIDEVVFYQDGKPVKKLEVLTDYEDGEFIYSTTMYKKVDGKWEVLHEGGLEIFNGMF